MIIFISINRITMSKVQLTKNKTQISDQAWLNDDRVMPPALAKKLRAQCHKKLETDLTKHHLRIL